MCDDFQLVLARKQNAQANFTDLVLRNHILLETESVFLGAQETGKNVLLRDQFCIFIQVESDAIVWLMFYIKDKQINEQRISLCAHYSYLASLVITEEDIKAAAIDIPMTEEEEIRLLENMEQKEEEFAKLVKYQTS